MVDTILIAGKIYTVDERRPWAEAVAIRDGKFAVVGSEAKVMDLAGPNTRTVNLEGRLVLPGLCDAHIHFYDWSMARRQVPIAGCHSLQDLQTRVAHWCAEAGASDWAIGRGWNENNWPDSDLPTRDDLDRVSGEGRPVILWRTDMHCAVANSAALRLAGITASTADPEGGTIGRDAQGRPNGLLYELAVNLVADVMPAPRAASVDQAVREGIAELQRLGVTAVHDQRMKGQYEGPVALAAYQRLRRDGQLRLRTSSNIAAHDLPHLAALGLRTGFGDDYLRLGHVKLFTDGSMGSQTAWMLEPYAGGRGGEGINVTPPAQMAAEIRQAAELGFPASVHAIGDRAIRTVLDIFEELAQGSPSPPVPHRVEHVQIIDPQDLTRLAALGLTASVQPIHVTDDMDMADRVLGSRADRVYRFRSLADSGALLALGSDAPVSDPNPFLGIHAALYRQRPERMSRGAWYADEKLNLAQAIEGYTLGAARAAGWAETIGSVSPGKRADLIVLDRDLFSLAESGDPGREIADTEVLMTFFDGELVYEA